MERQGRIYRLFEDGTALVLCTGNCAMECEQCAGCSKGRELLIARNPEGAVPGELVQIRVRRGRNLLTALMFLLPIVGFFAGYWLGAKLWGIGKVTGCSGFVLGSVIGHVYDRRIASKPGSGYTVITCSQNKNKGDNGFD